MGGEAKANPQGYQQAAQAVRTALESEGAPADWLTPMLELAARESSFDPTNQNPSSTAYGLFQFLNGTWGDTGVSKTDDPVQQAIAAVRYIKNRPNYGDPYKALQFWDKNKWY